MTSLNYTERYRWSPSIRAISRLGNSELLRRLPAANFSQRGGAPRTRDFLAALSPASYVDRLALFIRVRRGGAHPHYELSARRGAFRAHSTAAIEKSYSRRD